MQGKDIKDSNLEFVFLVVSLSFYCLYVIWEVSAAASTCSPVVGYHPYQGNYDPK